METKIRNYQTRVKSVNQENESLKDTLVQNQAQQADMEKELEQHRSQNKSVNQYESGHLRSVASLSLETA